MVVSEDRGVIVVVCGRKHGVLVEEVVVSEAGEESGSPGLMNVKENDSPCLTMRRLRGRQLLLPQYVLVMVS